MLFLFQKENPNKKQNEKQNYGELLDVFPNKFRIKCKFFGKAFKTPSLGTATYLCSFIFLQLFLFQTPIFCLHSSGILWPWFELLLLLEILFSLIKFLQALRTHLNVHLAQDTASFPPIEIPVSFLPDVSTALYLNLYWYSSHNLFCMWGFVDVLVSATRLPWRIKNQVSHLSIALLLLNIGLN